MKVSAQYAATHFDDILSAADNGEEVRIERPNKPGIRLVVESAPEQVAPRSTSRKHLFGAGKGLVTPPTDEEWAEMDQAIWQQPERPRSELFGSLAGKSELGDDWDSPETNREIQDLFEGSEDSSVTSHS